MVTRETLRTTDTISRHPIRELTRDWGNWRDVSLFLGRCQVDTPDNLVESTWRHVSRLRSTVGKVIDFGAGDGRFARYGSYSEYIGYEIDGSRNENAHLPPNAELRYCCAFSELIDDADLCIGNPPFVRNQDLPNGWRKRASTILTERTGVTLSGLSNAWQYFFLLSLASVRPDGVCALIVPYEWVSRPSVHPLRKYIRSKGWTVSVYRLVDETFSSVLTTSSITIIDKGNQAGSWSYFEERSSGKFASLISPSGTTDVIRYTPHSKMSTTAVRAVRGLSPGTQKVLTLSEGERAHCGLRIGRDVVPCITTLRHLPAHVTILTESAFREHYIEAGRKCWLIRTDSKRSKALTDYLESVPKECFQTSTCLERSEWWRFKMPPIPKVLVAMSFTGRCPKTVLNAVNVRAVGGVYGVYDATSDEATYIAEAIKGSDLTNRVVAHSQGLRKIEVNQLNTLISEALEHHNRSTVRR